MNFNDRLTLVLEEWDIINKFPKRAGAHFQIGEKVYYMGKPEIEGVMIGYAEQGGKINGYNVFFGSHYPKQPMMGNLSAHDIDRSGNYANDTYDLFSEMEQYRNQSWQVAEFLDAIKGGATSGAVAGSGRI